MNIHLMNAAAMPQPGRYELTEIREDVFFRSIETYAPRIVSHIGYEANRKLIEKQTGVRVELLRARDETPEMEPGDEILIMKLRRLDRIPQQPKLSDFLYFHCKYESF